MSPPFQLSFARRAAAPILAAAFLLLAGCAVPLAPGYEVRKQTIEARFTPGPAPKLAVRASYVLRNAGNTSLDSMEALLPDEKLSGLSALRVTLDGRDASLSPAAERMLCGIRIALDPPWPQRAQRSLVIEYELAPPDSSSSRGYVAGRALFFRGADWLPKLLPPKHFLAHSARPKSALLRVTLPVGDPVVASGRPLKDHRDGDLIEHRFELREFGLDPPLVAGAYVSSPHSQGKTTITFWTFATLPAGPAASAGKRLAGSAEVYASLFGPLARNAQSLWIVEAPEEINPIASASAFDSGVVLNSAAFAGGIDSETFLSQAERNLAMVWTTERMTPHRELRRTLAEGLAEYAVLAAARARNGDSARNAMIREWLRDWDAAPPSAAGRTLAFLPPNAPEELDPAARARAALFLVALEDRCGVAGMRAGLTRLYSALRGETYGYDELRSALELETHRDLADIFRAWINHLSIPDDFRAKYGAAQNP